MSNLPARWQPRSWLPDLSELFTGVRSWTGLRVPLEGHFIRLEDEIEDGHYVVRAELPGIDPAEDVEITVHNGRLTIKAERKESKGRSEFSHGSFIRSARTESVVTLVILPAGANEEDIKATYDKGILTVSVAVPEQAAPAEKHIPVQTTT